MRSEIVQAINIILQSIEEIKEIQNFEKNRIDKFPVAYIVATTSESEILGKLSRKKSQTISIKILQEITSGDSSEGEAEILLSTIAEKVTTALEDDETLGGAIDFLNVSCSMGWEEREKLMRRLDVTVTCNKLI